MVVDTGGYRGRVRASVEIEATGDAQSEESPHALVEA